VPDDYEPGSGPYDWQRATSHFGRSAGDVPIRAGEFYAVVDRLSEKIDAVHDHVMAFDERMFDTRAKRAAGEVVSSVWGRFLVIVLAVITAFVLTNFITLPWVSGP
jgi:hypothetical protein